MTTDQFHNALDGHDVIVIADDLSAAAAAEAAVRTFGVRLVATVTWSDARDRVAAQASAAILMIETDGVADDLIERLLPELVEKAGAGRAVVVFAAERLDQVGGVLIGTGAALLCDPTTADRVAALAMAGSTGPSDVRDSREEAARLAQINAEVARFTETLARLTAAPQGQHAAAAREALVGDRRPSFGQQPSSAAPLTAIDIRRAIRARRMRDEIFGLPGLFEDPAWDMLLDLFAAEQERSSVSVSSLCIAAAVAPTTALRWINKLIEVGLFERQPDSLDRRRAFIALTPRGTKALHDYFAAVRASGLSIA